MREETACIESNHQTTTADATPDGTAIISTIRNAALVRMEETIERLMSPTATDEDFLQAFDTEAGMKAVVRDYSAKLKEAAIDYINRNGPVETLNARFYVGPTKTTKCRDTARAVDAILQACGGDFDRFVGCLASQPLKHGECRGVLGDAWDQHFEVVSKDDIKTGAPARELQKGLPRAGGKEVDDGSA